MAFYGYNDDFDDSQWTPYSEIGYNHDLFPPQSSSTSSFNGFEEPESRYYYNQFDSDTIQSTVYFSDYSHLETTRLIHYENQQQQQQPSYVIESFYPQTNYITSYSTLEFNETEFEEYDDTPYGGGYDLALTYGKPLPPSDRICYPRSTPQPGSKFEIPEGFSYGSISSPYGEISNSKPQVPANGIKSDDHDNKEDISTKESFDNGKNDSIIENPIEVDRVNVVDDLSYNNDERKGLGNEGYGDHVTKYPYGSGLETFDICDGIFGYWPCLDKRKQQNLAKSVENDDQNRMDPWKSAADYLFGSGYVYEESRGMSHGHGYYDDGHHFDYSYNYAR